MSVPKHELYGYPYLSVMGYQESVVVQCLNCYSTPIWTDICDFYLIFRNHNCPDIITC